jgi:hypothetical protein
MIWMTHAYKILPSGNRFEFPLLDDELRRRGVVFDVSEFPTGARMYRFPTAQLGKFPKGGSGRPVLGFDDDRGYYTLSYGYVWEESRIEWGGSPWKRVS